MSHEMLRASDVAAEMSLTTGRVYQLLRAGSLPSVRVGGRILIPRAAWEQFVADQARAAMAGMKEGRHAEAV